MRARTSPRQRSAQSVSITTSATATNVDAMDEFSTEELAALDRYSTNVDRRVFALRNLPEVVKGALFSRYSRTEKSLRRVLLDEFINEPDSGFDQLAATQGGADASVAERAGAHVAVERVSTLAAKALEDSRIGISPLEKSTRYVRFDRLGPDGRFLYHRGPELAHPDYEAAADALFQTYSQLIEPVTLAIRERFPLEEDETDRAWKSATRAKALDVLRGLLPAGTLTNLGLFGNGRAFEYLITKMAAHELPECRTLAGDLHRELALVIPAFVKRALDERYGAPSAERMKGVREATDKRAPRTGVRGNGPSVRLLEHDPDAEGKVVAAALFPHSDAPWEDLHADPAQVLEALLADRANRRQRPARALEHAQYTFEIVANFAAYRDLHRHRMLTQDRQLLGTSLGFDVPAGLAELGMEEQFVKAIDGATVAHKRLEHSLGPTLAQYVVPLAYRFRWYFSVNLREIYHLCELRTTPQGHSDYRWVAQEMFRLVREVHPRLAGYARFVDMGPGDELERRRSERRLDEKLSALDLPLL